MLLYLPLAHNFGRLMHLLGAHLGFTIAFCPDPRRIGEVMPAGSPDDPADRAPRAREGAHGGLRELRRRNRSQAAADRLGARASAGG